MDMVFKGFPSKSPWGCKTFIRPHGKMGVRVIIVDEDKGDRLTCPVCSEVFDKPHQAECGDRYCEECLNKLISSSPIDVKCLCCNEILKSSVSFRDFACQRELNTLLVKCGWASCEWQGNFMDFKEHESNYCKFVPVKCKQCDRMVTREEMDKHTVMHEEEMAGAADERDGGGQRMIDQNNGIIAVDQSSNTSPLARCEEEAKKLHQMLEELQTNYTNLFLIVQSLQATSYNGKYIWKIPEVARRCKEAKEGKTLSLYSAPFYTSRHGYRMCLRLYLNGDGTGKGTHLSYFLTIMRGEFDALLPWPFQQVVRLSLRSQNLSKNDIRHCFKPDGTSSSFMRPRADTNIASGCPKFAPVSTLSDGEYVQDDTLFLQCNIDLTGIEGIN